MTNTVFDPPIIEPTLPESPEAKRKREIKERAAKIRKYTKLKGYPFQVVNCKCKKHMKYSPIEECTMGKWKYYDDKGVECYGVYNSEDEALVACYNDSHWLEV